jgi:hypothetical protein
MKMNSLNTPTASELATFEVLANREFVNMNRPPLGGEPVEEEDDIGLDNFEEDEYEEDDAPPSTNVRVEEEERTPDVPLETPERPEQRQEPRMERPERQDPRPEKKAYDTKTEIDVEKEALLVEIYAMEKQGVKLVRQLSMADSLEEIQFQYDRMMSEQNAIQMVDIAKQGIKMGSGMLEMSMKKMGIQVVDGYHKNLCADMGKFNRPLGRLYKKYWRRGGMSPEAELAMIVFGSLAWTVVQNKMSGVDIFASDKPAEKKPDLKPATMPSMNINTVWSEDTTDELKKAKETFEAVERQMANALAASEARERALQAQLQAQEQELPSKRVMIQTTSTPSKSSSKKKTATINLDED